jgi:hypothetical protein
MGLKNESRWVSKPVNNVMNTTGKLLAEIEENYQRMNDNL